MLLGSFWLRLDASSCFLGALEAPPGGDLGCHFGSKEEDDWSHVRFLACSGF